MKEEVSSPVQKSALHKLSMRHLAAVFAFLIIIGGALALMDASTRAQVASWYDSIFSSAGSTKPHGNLFLTLESESRISTRTLDVATGELVYQKLDGTRALEWVAVSPSGKERAYVLSAVDAQPAEIRVETIATKERRTILSPAPESVRHLGWSPDGETIVFTARTVESESETDIEPNDWAVYTVSARGGEAERVALGTSPFFSPDGSIVLSLQNNGLYATSLSDGLKKIVRSMQGGVAHRFMHIAPSPDGTKLLWTNPLSENREGKIFVFDITSWNPITISEMARVVRMPALHATFSPDSAYIAFLTNPQESASANPGVYLLDLADLSTREIFDLAGFDLRQTALTDWR